MTALFYMKQKSLSNTIIPITIYFVLTKSNQQLLKKKTTTKNNIYLIFNHL